MGSCSLAERLAVKSNSLYFLNICLLFLRIMYLYFTRIGSGESRKVLGVVAVRFFGMGRGGQGDGEELGVKS